MSNYLILSLLGLLCLCGAGWLHLKDPREMKWLSHSVQEKVKRLGISEWNHCEACYNGYLRKLHSTHSEWVGTLFIIGCVLLGLVLHHYL